MNQQQQAQYERLLRSKRLLPYLLLESGPTESPCAVHQANFGIVLHVEHPFWTSAGFRQYHGCKCRFRGLTYREVKELDARGGVTWEPAPLGKPRGAP